MDRLSAEAEGEGKPMEVAEAEVKAEEGIEVRNAVVATLAAAVGVISK